MIGFYDYTVIATYLATVFGVAGMVQASEGRLMTALLCLLLCGLLDTVDGRIARTKKNRTDAEKRFGIQIDSLNDVLCFGVLPALIAYSGGKTVYGTVPNWYVTVLCFFVLCGLIRLAYFNVTEEERQSQESGNRKMYLGLPITASSLVLPLIMIVFVLTRGNPLSFAIGLLVTGFLHIMPLKIPKPGIVGIVIMALCGAAEMGALVYLLL